MFMGMGTYAKEIALNVRKLGIKALVNPNVVLSSGKET